jgi:dihydrofolate reductase
MIPDVVYYVACSLDGYIATTDGGVDWLEPFQAGGDDYGFAEFSSSIDALVMGSRTYEFALKHGPWQAPDKPSWVFTHRALPVTHPSITLTAEDPAQVIEAIGARGLERVWLMGGGELAASFRARGLISHYIIAVVPVVLGAGVPLFASTSEQTSLRLIEVKPLPNGLVQLSYEPKAETGEPGPT